MAIESKDLLVAIKSYARGEALPLDSSEVHDSLESAQNYAKSATAYAGQTIKALVNGEYVSYVLQPSGGSLELKKVGVDTEAVKNYVQIIGSLPESGQEQGVLYINTADSKGYIYNGSTFVEVFEQVDGLSTKINTVESDIVSINDSLNKLNGSAETDGSVLNAIKQSKEYIDSVKSDIDESLDKKANADSVYTKEAADAAIQRAVTDSGHLKRSIVDELPEVADADQNTIYMVPKANADGVQQHYDEFMFLNGAFEKIGDTKVDLSDYATIESVDSAIDAAKAVVAEDAQTKANAARDAAIESAAITAQAKSDAALEAAKVDAKTKADDALAAAKEYSDGLAKNYEVAGAADAALVDAKAYADDQKAAAEKVAKDYTDSLIATVNGNLNTKVTADDVSAAINERVGDITEGTSIKDYIDTTIGSSETDFTEAIAKAKEEANAYTDNALIITEF